MIITSSALELNASHQKQQRHEISASLSVWAENRGANRADSRNAGHERREPLEAVAISDAGKTAQSSEANAIKEGLDAAERDPILRLIRTLIAMMTGQEARVFNARDLSPGTTTATTEPPTRPRPPETPDRQNTRSGAQYNFHESYTESEQTTFDASGTVRTADGKTISFTLALSMSRSYREESNLRIEIGDARQTKDPLVINFTGSAAQLTNQRFEFDLDADGKADSVNFVSGGSGFLALDRNGDGKINDGSELFGTRSGDGFSELSAFDGDQNGWIDENDAVYEKLLIWTKDDAGNDQLATLKEANVGALSLSRVATPFDIKDGSNALQGQIRASGIYLQEDGRVGTLQQVDLTV